MPPDLEPRNRAAATLKLLRRRVGQRSQRLRSFALIGVQSGLAAALAWVVARQVLNNPDPVFAPVVAISVIASAIGQHLPRTLQLLGGVVLGVATGDFLINLIGVGAWQLGAVVAVAVVLAIALDGSSTPMSQSGGTAVLVVALSPVKADLEVPRFINAAVRGAVGLGVYLLLLPLHPLRLVDRRARPVVDLFVSEFEEVADALSTSDLKRVESALRRLREADSGLRRAQDAVSTAMEVVTLAPARRHRRPILVAYGAGFVHLERALRNSRGTIRRIADMLRDGEPVPAALPSGIRRLGDAARAMHLDLLAGRSTVPARTSALGAAIDARRGFADSPGLHGTIVLTEVRTVAFDLLRASGADRAQARALLREAEREAR